MEDARGLAIHRIDLHHLYARPVGIEQSHLALVVHPQVDLHLAPVVLARRTRLQRRHGLLNIRYHQADVMRAAAPVRRRQLFIEHELHVVIAVRHAHVDPVQRRAGEAVAAPGLATPQDSAIESRRGFQVAHQNSGVHHAARNTRGGHVFTRVLPGPAIGHILHDLHRVPVRIHHRNLAIPDPVRGHLLRRFDAARPQVLAHPLYVVGVKAQVIQLALPLTGRIDQFQVLMIVDFHKGHLHRAVWFRQRKRFFVPQKILIKRARLRQIAHEDGVVRHPQNLRPGRLCLGRKRQPDQNSGQTSHIRRIS